jgi:hypothetical protein
MISDVSDVSDVSVSLHRAFSASPALYQMLLRLVAWREVFTDSLGGLGKRVEELGSFTFQAK